MSSTLSGNTVSSTYVSLLKTADNADITGSLKTVTGGTGTDSALQISSAGVKSTGTLAADGATTLGGTLGVTGAVSLTVPLAAASGGTGQDSYTTGDLLYASGASAISKLADVAAGQVLVSGGVGVAPAWSASPTVTGSLKSSGPTSGVGYAVGAGGSVTQSTSKSTGVTLNKVCGQITTHNATLADGAIVGFILTNSNIAVTDVIVLSLNSSGISTGSYQYWVDTVGLGTCYIYIRNVSGSDKSEAIVINFAIIKAAIT